MLRARESVEPGRCAAELSDARVDVIGYACLVGDHEHGQGYHRVSQQRLQQVTHRETGRCIQVVTAGALVGVDVLVLSSCVQMPSLAAAPIVEQESGLPVVSASIATTYQMLKQPRADSHRAALLSGRY